MRIFFRGMSSPLGIRCLLIYLIRVLTGHFQVIKFQSLNLFGFVKRQDPNFKCICKILHPLHHSCNMWSQFISVKFTNYVNTSYVAEVSFIIIHACNLFEITEISCVTIRFIHTCSKTSKCRINMKISNNYASRSSSNIYITDHTGLT